MSRTRWGPCLRGAGSSGSGDWKFTIRLASSVHFTSREQLVSQTALNGPQDSRERQRTGGGIGHPQSEGHEPLRALPRVH